MPSLPCSRTHAAWGLGAAHALLHACVHRASNLSAGLGDRLKWLYDLHLPRPAEMVTLKDPADFRRILACRRAGVPALD